MNLLYHGQIGADDVTDNDIGCATFLLLSQRKVSVYQPVFDSLHRRNCP